MFQPFKDNKSTKILFLVNLYFAFLNIASADNLDLENSISKVELVGTITGKHALAILRLENQLEGIYQLNQTILGYTIKSISEKICSLNKKQ